MSPNDEWRRFDAGELEQFLAAVDKCLAAPARIVLIGGSAAASVTTSCCRPLLRGSDRLRNLARRGTQEKDRSNEQIDRDGRIAGLHLRNSGLARLEDLRHLDLREPSIR